MRTGLVGVPESELSNSSVPDVALSVKSSTQSTELPAPLVTQTCARSNAPGATNALPYCLYAVPRIRVLVPPTATPALKNVMPAYASPAPEPSLAQNFRRYVLFGVSLDVT